MKLREIKGWPEKADFEIEVDEKEISRIIELNLEDADNFPSMKVFADSTAKTIAFNLPRILRAKKG